MKKTNLLIKLFLIFYVSVIFSFYMQEEKSQPTKVVLIANNTNKLIEWTLTSESDYDLPKTTAKGELKPNKASFTNVFGPGTVTLNIVKPIKKIENVNIFKLSDITILNLFENSDSIDIKVVTSGLYD